jgi:formylglycine-generating enzyme required for sulfatase activity
MDEDVGFRYVVDEVPLAPPDRLDECLPVQAGSYSVGLAAQQVPSLIHTLQAPQGSVDWFASHEKRVVHIEEILMRRYLVTNEEYYEFVQRTGYPWPAFWSKELLRWSDRPFLDKYRHHPVIGVAYKDSVAFCSWRGGRLPTNDEWEAAARGERSWLYPWGSSFQEGYANFSEAGLARTSRVGEFSAGASPFGVQDLAGNVKEWVAMDSSGGCTVRGGAFHELGPIYGLTFLRIEADPDVTRRYIGFRYVMNG